MVDINEVNPYDIQVRLGNIQILFRHESKCHRGGYCHGIYINTCYHNDMQAFIQIQEKCKQTLQRIRLCHKQIYIYIERERERERDLPLEIALLYNRSHALFEEQGERERLKD